MDFFTVDKLEMWLDVYLVPFAVNLVLALLIFVVGRAVARMLARLVERIAARSKLEPSLGGFISDIAYALMLAVVAVAALERLGVKTTAAIAILGAAGLAVGLALQGSLGNFAAGVMILSFKPYRVGDVVNMGGHFGSVEQIKMFHTILVTFDNRVIMMPNGQILDGTIENLSIKETRRCDLVFGISYADDVAAARAMIEEVLANEPRLLEEPEPTVAVSELGDSSVNFIIRPWTKAADLWPVKWALTEALKKAADERGITIPFPQRDVHLHQEPKRAA